MFRDAEPYEQDVFNALRRHNFKSASSIRAKYEASLREPRGINVDWKNYNTDRDVALLKAVWEGQPEILAGMDRSQAESIRLAAGMSIIGTNDIRRWLVSDVQTGTRFSAEAAARMWTSHAYYTAEMVFLRSLKPIKAVRVMSANDEWVCDVCRALHGKVFPKEEAPVLPYKHCMAEDGCRCGISSAMFLD